MIGKDTVQASEKLYKVAEEAVKALAIALNLDEAKKTAEIGRWTAQLLFDPFIMHQIGSANRR